MPDGLHEHDALAWADRQAALLGRLAAGEGVNEAVDWPHVAEDVQDVGLSELRACQSLLEQAMTHLLKLHAMPDSPPARHRRDEVQAFRHDLQRRFTPSMRQRTGLDDLYKGVGPGAGNDGRRQNRLAAAARGMLACLGKHLGRAASCCGAGC